MAGKYHSLEKITLAEFVIRCRDMKKVSTRKSHWLHLIKTNQLKCPISGERVDYCSYDVREGEGSFHYNFYSKSGDLFTIDHIVPKSKGGKDYKDNVQPMLSNINNFKLDKNISNEKLKELWQIQDKS